MLHEAISETTHNARLKKIYLSCQRTKILENLVYNTPFLKHNLSSKILTGNQMQYFSNRHKIQHWWFNIWHILLRTTHISVLIDWEETTYFWYGSRNRSNFCRLIAIQNYWKRPVNKTCRYPKDYVLHKSHEYCQISERILQQSVENC